MQVCMQECVMGKQGGTEGAVLRDEKPQAVVFDRIIFG